MYCNMLYIYGIMIGYMYILLCGNGSFYTGSTINLKKRLEEHQQGIGSNHTKRYQPVELVYYETFERIDQAFEREKQVQRWSHDKKEALINGNISDLKMLAGCRNSSHYKNKQ